jgi:hypothetical protein
LQTAARCLPPLLLVMHQIPKKANGI